MLSRAKTAFEAKEYAWAAQLLGYLMRREPFADEVLALKADVLEQTGRITPAHTIRSWYTSQARALRGEVAIPPLVFANTRLLTLAPPAVFMEQFGVRIAPERSADLDQVVAMRITDQGTQHCWHLRRGVVEFIADVAQCRRAPELELASNYDTWLRFFSCKLSLADFLAAADISTGSLHSANRFLSAFDDLSDLAGGRHRRPDPVSTAPPYAVHTSAKRNSECRHFDNSSVLRAQILCSGPLAHRGRGRQT